MRTLLFPLLTFAVLAANAGAALPTYDHVVVVIEENEDADEIIGNSTKAPFINQLANQGVVFADYHAFTHPSQPNYLQLFSGADQRVIGDDKPRQLPFTTANLGAKLRAGGHSFIGYSEGLPAPGDASTVTALTADGRDGYARRHNPWSNWQVPRANASAPFLPPSVNQPFGKFPSDFTQLPAVAFVIPNNQHNMHSNSVRVADQWLSQHLGAYAAWAPTHHSLLVVTFDENEGKGQNVVPAIFVGADLRPGVNPGAWNHHNLLRTLADLFGVEAPGGAQDVPPMSGCFTGESDLSTRSFRAGNAGTNSLTAVLRANTANAAHPTPSVLAVGPGVQALIRFDNLFGSTAGQIPTTATIASAKLRLHVRRPAPLATTKTIALHRMVAAWDGTATWAGFGGGVAADDTEAALTPDSKLSPHRAGDWTEFDVTASLRAWIAGGTNNGWVLRYGATGGVAFDGAAAVVPAAQRPQLTVSFVP